jgi:DNA-directed RNA polymerase subunit omega
MVLEGPDHRGPSRTLPRHPKESIPVIEPKIDDLQARVDSRYTLVILAAKRAREINSYYSQLGEGRGEYVPPLVETGDLRSKPLAIALQEIAEGKVNYERLETPGIK